MNRQETSKQMLAKEIIGQLQKVLVLTTPVILMELYYIIRRQTLQDIKISAHADGGPRFRVPDLLLLLESLYICELEAMQNFRTLRQHLLGF